MLASSFVFTSKYSCFKLPITISTHGATNSCWVYQQNNLYHFNTNMDAFICIIIFNIVLFLLIIRIIDQYKRSTQLIQLMLLGFNFDQQWNSLRLGLLGQDKILHLFIDDYWCVQSAEAQNHKKIQFNQFIYPTTNFLHNLLLDFLLQQSFSSSYCKGTCRRQQFMLKWNHV